MFPLRQPRLAEGTETEQESSYLASASDLMIGLLFIFIVLVVVLALEQTRQRDEIIKAGDPRGQVTTSIGMPVQKELPTVEINPSTGVISLPEEVLFDLASAELKPTGRIALHGAMTALAKSLPCYVANRRRMVECKTNSAGHEIETIFIEGHTDNLPLRRANYDNVDLSLDRARAVYGALVDGNLLSEYRNHYGQPLFSLSAYGETRPRPGMDPSHPRNRRVDLRIVLSYRPPAELLGKQDQSHGER